MFVLSESSIRHLSSPNMSTLSTAPSASAWTSTASTDERFYCMTATPGESFEEEAARLLAEYDERCGGDKHELLLRFHLSDATRQTSLLKQLLGNRRSYVTCIGQAPANGAKIALEAWHIDGSSDKQIYRDEQGSLLIVKWQHYTMLLTGKTSLRSQGSHDQTHEEFAWLDSVAARFHTPVSDLVHRTWIYCRDVDNNYAGLVNGRNETFSRYGLTKDTHFIASTGIEGQSEHPARLIHMDSWGQIGHVPTQVEYMEALDHLSPTHLYNVAFERGTRIIYGDRSRYFISGTASIDAAGEIVHPGDVNLQTIRTLENIQALMTNHQGRLEDLKQATVYLRDWADAGIVSKILDKSPLGQIPHIIVKAPVCRPGWLVEIDAIAVNSAGSSAFHPLI